MPKDSFVRCPRTVWLTIMLTCPRQGHRSLDKIKSSNNGRATNSFTFTSTSPPLYNHPLATKAVNAVRPHTVVIVAIAAVTSHSRERGRRRRERERVSSSSSFKQAREKGKEREQGWMMANGAGTTLSTIYRGRSRGRSRENVRERASML